MFFLKAFREPEEDPLLARAAKGDEAAAQALAAKAEARRHELRARAGTSWWGRMQYRRELEDSIEALTSLRQHMEASAADASAMASIDKDIAALRAEAGRWGSFRGSGRPGGHRSRSQLRRSVEDGIAFGLVLAKHYSFLAALPLVAIIILAFAKGDHGSLRALFAIPSYFVGFAIGGAVAGALSPYLGAYRLGRMFIGFLAVIPISLLVTIIAVPEPAWTGSLLSALGFAALIGPAGALVWEAT